MNVVFTILQVRTKVKRERERLRRRKEKERCPQMHGRKLLKKG